LEEKARRRKKGEDAAEVEMEKKGEKEEAPGGREAKGGGGEIDEKGNRVRGMKMRWRKGEEEEKGRREGES
jgi:hypothetical protein